MPGLGKERRFDFSLTKDVIEGLKVDDDFVCKYIDNAVLILFELAWWFH